MWVTRNKTKFQLGVDLKRRQGSATFLLVSWRPNSLARQELGHIIPLNTIRLLCVARVVRHKNATAV